MESIEVVIEGRSELGSSANFRLRREGFIPAVVYAIGKESKSVKLPEVLYRRAIAGKGQTQLFVLKSGDRDLNGKMALIKNVQHEPLRGDVLHIDFYSFAEDQRIRVEVPIRLVGECLAVKHGDSILNHLLHKIDVECLPTAIPAAFDVDITNLVEGHSLHVRDIVVPAGVVIKTPTDSAIVSVVHHKEEVVATPEAAAATEPQVVGAELKEGQAAAGAPSGEKEKEKK